MGSVAVALGLLPLAFADERRGGNPPKLVQVSYAESDDGSSPKRSLQAYAKRAEAVKFATRFDGDSARGKAKYRESITDTDLNGEASHPWALVRRDGGGRVLKLIHRSLGAREKARVKVILKGKSERVVERVVIRVADCAQDPPLYPLSCEIRP